MAAPLNDEARNQIYEAALELFRSRGYTKTTYKDIAKTCGTTKSMVQHYYPKKEQLAVRFFEQHLEEIHIRATELAGDDKDPLVLFCLMGLMHFDFLMNDSGMKLFSHDVIENRSLTNTIVISDREWAKQRIAAKELTVSVEDALTISLGGAYELIYQLQGSEKKASALYVERAAIVPFALAIGYDRGYIENVLDRCGKILGDSIA